MTPIRRPPHRPARLAAPTAVLCAVAAAAACTGPPGPPASGDPAGTSLVFAVPTEPASLSPLSGYAPHGAAKIFDGLVEHQANRTLRPALASGLPQPSADGKSYKVGLRSGVTFSDGSVFDARDVVATYQALLDPKYASPVRARFAMLTRVMLLSPTEVRFDLSRPYAPFPHLLVLGILPSEAVAAPGTASPGETTAVVGTGPYRLAEYQPGERMVLEANQSYFDGPPAVTKVTVEFIPDDEVRAARMREGKLDGAVLPPTLARTFDGVDGLRVVAHSAADVRAVVLPAGNPVTADPAMRLALNYAVDREAAVSNALSGKGTPASSPVPNVLAEFAEPTARFPYDIAKALDVLEAGGWLPGSGGARAKSGRAAGFVVRYPPGDIVNRELATVFATAATAIGVPVTAEESSGGATPDTDAVLVGFGDPFDPDLALYPALRSATTNRGVTAALELGRTGTDPAQRAIAYRKLQRAYLDAPDRVVLAVPDHNYVLRESWNGYQPVIDAAQVDATWGAWWNVQEWTPR